MMHGICFLDCVLSQGPGSLSVSGRPEGAGAPAPAQWAARPAYRHHPAHTDTHTRRHTPTSMHGSIHCHLVLRGVLLYILCLSCVFLRM
jgi:sugar phosphate permease